jgi:hypothetical protein
LPDRLAGHYVTFVLSEMHGQLLLLLVLVLHLLFLPSLQRNAVEIRLKLAEKVAKQRADKTAEESATAAQQQQPAAAAADIDALAAEIEALNSSSTAAAESASNSKKSKKLENLKRQRAKQQLKERQPHRRAQQDSTEGSDVEAESLAASSTAEAAAATGHPSKLMSSASNQAEHSMPNLTSIIAARLGQQSQKQIEQQQQQQDLQDWLPSPRRHVAKHRHSQQQQAAAAAAATAAQKVAPACEPCARPVDVQSAGAAAARTTAAPSAARSRIVGNASTVSSSACADRPADASWQPSTLQPVVAVSADLHTPAEAAGAAVVRDAPGSSAAPSMLENWRGSLNPIFMYNRQGGSSSGSSVTPAAAVSSVGAAAASAGPGSLQWSVSFDAINSQQQQQKQVVASSAQHASAAVAASNSSALLPSATGAPGSASSTAAAASGTLVRRAAKSQRKKEKCIVCLDAPRDVLLLPCKHLVLCSGCAEQMEGRGALGSCPYCRQACVQRVRIHA